MQDEDFGSLLDETFRDGDGFAFYNVGDRVKGTIVSLGNGSLLVDIGQRSEASIGMENFTPEELAGMQIGDSIEASVIKFSGGGAILSKSIGGRGADMSTIRMAKEANLPVEAKVTGHNKGGFTVSVGPVRGFVPISQMEIGPALDPAEYEGQVFSFLVMEVREQEAVLSRAGLLRREQAAQREEVLAGLKPGLMVHAKVVKVEKFGIFVDVGGGLHALVPISEIGWHGKDEILAGMAPGMEMDVEITAVGEKEGRPRISASLRKAEDDPWISASGEIREGMTVTGRVTRLMAFGAFVEIIPGIEGLVHISEISSGKRIRHPGDVLSIGQAVEARILKVEDATRRIGLSIKVLQPSMEPDAQSADPDAAIQKEILKKYSPSSAATTEQDSGGETAFSIAMKKAFKK